jgi:hypothetical protein
VTASIAGTSSTIAVSAAAATHFVVSGACDCHGWRGA